MGWYVFIISVFRNISCGSPKARQRQEYFKQFPHGWAIEEFIKSSLKNKRAYAHRHGYLQELKNASKASDGEHSGDDDNAGDGADGNTGGNAGGNADDDDGSDGGEENGSGKDE